MQPRYVHHPLPRTLGLLILPTEGKEVLKLPLRLQVSWLCAFLAMPVLLIMLVIYAQLLPSLSCA